MFRVFDRYLLKEVIKGWLAVTLFLWLILVSNRLVDYLGDAVSGDIPANLIFKLIGLKMVWYLVQVVPFALALGVVLALGRLYRDNEMTVMSACGVGPWNIYKPLLGFGTVIAIILAWLSLSVSPELQGMSFKLETLAKQRAGLTLLGAGRFNELQSGRLIFYAERLSADKQNMENLFIVLRNRKKLEKLPQLLTARSAYRKIDAETGDSFLVLVDGYRYEGKPGEANYRIMKFRKYGVRIDLPGAPKVQEKQESIPSAVLLQSADPIDVAELQWRLVMPVSVIVLLLLAVPLCKSAPREGHYGRMVVAILLFVIYYNLLATAKYWVGEGTVPAVIGLWWVPVLPVLLMMVLLNSERILCLLRVRR